MKICRVKAKLLHVDGRTDGWTDRQTDRETDHSEANSEFLQFGEHA